MSAIARGAGGHGSRRAHAHVSPTKIDFSAVNRAALAALPTLLMRWLPDGRKQGDEWIARNPHRQDRALGSFRVNINSGRWADFAVEGARGGDPVSLLAYVEGLGQVQAARRLAVELRQ